MKHRLIIFVLLSIISDIAYSEIPEWYKRDIVNHIQNAEAVILYEVKKLSFVSKRGIYYTYRIDTKTIEKLKGLAPKGECYMIHTEGNWNSPYEIGDKAIVILNAKYEGECGVIESGYGTPATQEYIDLFNSILIKTPNQSK